MTLIAVARANIKVFGYVGEIRKRRRRRRTAEEAMIRSPRGPRQVGWKSSGPLDRLSPFTRRKGCFIRHPTCRFILIYQRGLLYPKPSEGPMYVVSRLPGETNPFSSRVHSFFLSQRGPQVAILSAQLVFLKIKARKTLCYRCETAEQCARPI